MTAKEDEQTRDLQRTCSDEQFLEELLSSSHRHLQRTYSDEWILEELLSSIHRQPTANRRITDDEKTEGNDEQRLQYLRSSH